MVDNTDLMFLAQLDRDFRAMMLATNSNITDAQRVLVAEFHQPWKAQAYGTNEVVKYRKTDEGRSQLYTSLRAIKATDPPPDVVTSPVNWKKL